MDLMFRNTCGNGVPEQAREEQGPHGLLGNYNKGKPEV